jgi:hypothetical protein
MIEEVVENHLADYCYIARDFIRISVGGNVVSFSSGEGFRFLGLLLRGWKQTPSSVQTFMSAASIEEKSAADTAPEHPAAAKSQAMESDQQHPPNWMSKYNSYLNLTLAMSKEMGLIVDFSRDAKSDLITIQTAATAIEMSSVDAFEYLSDIIAEEMRRREST